MKVVVFFVCIVLSEHDDEETVEPAHTITLTSCRSTTTAESACSSWPLLVSTLEINYDLFWHNRNPLCGAGQIVALGMFRHESILQ